MDDAEDAYGTITKISSTILALPPSCIEFSAIEPEYFVVGTYNLQKEENKQVDQDDVNDDDGNEESSSPKKQQSKNGSLILFKIEDDQLNLIQTFAYPSAILDLHFSPHTPSTFSTVSSTGAYSTFSLSKKPPDNSLNIIEESTHQLFPKEIAITYFTFHPYDDDLFAVTLDTGAVHVVKKSMTSLDVSGPIIAHTFHAWYVAFSLELSDPFNPLEKTKGTSGRIIYSGGDDNRLRVANLEIDPTTTSFETQTETGAQSESSANDQPQKQIDLSPRGHPLHEAGVTAILPLQLENSDKDPGFLLTGSYDDHVRVIDTRGPYPKVPAKLYIGGGVWRLKVISQHHEVAENGSEEGIFCTHVLASCMHAGARVLEVKCSITGNLDSMKGVGVPAWRSEEVSVEWSDWSIEILGAVTDHKSMNYGSDIQPTVEDVVEDNKGRLCVSTSFYDRLLCVWRFKAPTGKSMGIERPGR